MKRLRQIFGLMMLLLVCVGVVWSKGKTLPPTGASQSPVGSVMELSLALTTPLTATVTLDPALPIAVNLAEKLIGLVELDGEDN